MAEHGKLRVAIAGAGLMGSWHARYARNCGANVCAIVDPVPPAAEKLASRHGNAVAFKELSTLLKQARPDVLHICSPVETHQEMARQAIEAGINVLVEKPLTLTAAASEVLLRLAAERGVLLMPVHQFVFQDGVIEACAVLPGIEPVLHLDAVVCSAGGGQLHDLDALAADIIVHPLSMVERFIPGALASTRWTLVRTIGGEWRAIGSTAGGISIAILISLHGRPTNCSFRVIGAGGSIHMDLFHGFGLTTSGRVSRTEKIAAPFSFSTRQLWSASFNLTRRLVNREPAYPGLARLIGEFYAAVQSRSAAPLSSTEVLSVARARDTLIEQIHAAQVL